MEGIVCSVSNKNSNKMQLGLVEYRRYWMSYIWREKKKDELSNPGPIVFILVQDSEPHCCWSKENNQVFTTCVTLDSYSTQLAVWLLSALFPF